MDGAFEIRTRPAGVRAAGLLNRVTRHWCLRVDPAAGTVTWSTRGRPGHETRMRLPGRGPAELAELARVSLADTFDPADAPAGPLRWLVFLGHDGRALRRASGQLRSNFRSIFDDDAFDVLTRYGIEVVHETFPTSRALDACHPGAIPRIRTSRSLFWAVVLGIGVLVIVTVLVIMLFG